MRTLRFPIAWLLLLCLTRTLLPEAWILALHPHAHTTDEPAQGPAFRHKGKAVIGAKHQHCPVEHFYQVPFAAARALGLPRPANVPCYPALRLPGRRPAVLAGLRGPAVGRAPPHVDNVRPPTGVGAPRPPAGH